MQDLAESASFGKDSCGFTSMSLRAASQSSGFRSGENTRGPAPIDQVLRTVESLVHAFGARPRESIVKVECRMIPYEFSQWRLVRDRPYSSSS